MTSKQETLRALRDEAWRTFRSGNFAKALLAFEQLERLDLLEAEWPRRAAECHGALRRPKQRADALARAAQRFVDAGFVNKASALCTLALSVDRSNPRALELSSTLNCAPGELPASDAPLEAESAEDEPSAVRWRPAVPPDAAPAGMKSRMAKVAGFFKR